MSFGQAFLDLCAPYRKIFDYRAAPKEAVSICPGCSGGSNGSFERFCEIDRYGFRVETCRCTNCNLLFVSPRLTEREYSLIYDAGTYRKLIRAYSGGKDDHSFAPDRVIALTRLIANDLKSRPVRVLNIGGTRADFTVMSKELTISEYTCLNPGMEEAGEGYEVINCNFELYEAGDRKFDLVCLFGTLNHLMWPYEAFRKVTSLLSPDGIFAFDYKDPIKKMARMTHPAGGLQFDHPVYPTPYTIGVILHQSGLIVRKAASLNDRVLFYVVCLGDTPRPDDAEFQAESHLLSELKKKGRHMTFGMVVRAVASLFSDPAVRRS